MNNGEVFIMTKYSPAIGTYYYVIELNDPLFPDPITGPITIIR